MTQYCGLSRDGAVRRIGKIKIKIDGIAPFESLYCCSIMERYLRTTLRPPDLHNIFRSTPERWHFIFESITQYNMHMRAFTICSFCFLHIRYITMLLSELYIPVKPYTQRVIQNVWVKFQLYVYRFVRCSIYVLNITFVTVHSIQNKRARRACRCSRTMGSDFQSQRSLLLISRITKSQLRDASRSPYLFFFFTAFRDFFFFRLRFFDRKSLPHEARPRVRTGG